MIGDAIQFLPWWLFWPGLALYFLLVTVRPLWRFWRKRALLDADGR